MDFEWTVTDMQVVHEPVPNTVTMTGFKVSRDGHSVDYRVDLQPADPEKFLDLQAITHDMAVEWTKAALGPIRVKEMEDEVQRMVDAAEVQVPKAVPLPWAPPELPEPDASNEEPRPAKRWWGKRER